MIYYTSTKFHLPSFLHLGDTGGHFDPPWSVTLPPCIMCVQYSGACSVHRGVFSTSGDTMSTSGDTMSTSGDTMSTSGDTMSTLRGYNEYIGGIS